MSSSFKKADILIPKNNVDMTKWSVVACDQFTSQPDYWNEVEKIVDTEKSTLHLTFPEIYLEEGNDRIKKINENMNSYIASDIFKEYKNTLIYTKRTLATGKIRKGLIGAIDLEDYSFEKGSKSNVRATEGTVLERIPPRVKIRENAPLEFPHIMILIDDEEKKIIEPIDNILSSLEKIYDFSLMMNGGKIEGYIISPELCDRVIENIEILSLKDSFINRYGIDAPLLTFAVGDGNHSLATAKTCWENIKKTLNEDEIKSHPARYALVELVNLHDDSLEFEPIHRVVFNVDYDDITMEFKSVFELVSPDDVGAKKIIITHKNSMEEVYIKDDKNNLEVGSLQGFIDSYLLNHPDASVDYIHGEDVVLDLSNNHNNVGFLLPVMKKNELFKTVILDGSLPRKTFSIGEACEKRYYLEGKKIK